MEADATTERTTETPVISQGAGHGRLKIAAGIAAILALMFLAKTLNLQEHLLDLVGWIRGAGWLGLAIFGLVYVAATVLFLPGSVLTLGAGFAYGVGLGTLITNVSELAAGRASGGDMQQVFYFAGLAATVAVSVYVTRIARRALAETTENGADRESSSLGPLA